MPRVADSSAPADADGSAAIAAHLQPHRQAEVLGNSSHAQPLRGTLDDASQLHLAGAKRNGLPR
eukprot:15130055-Alexandrium_andersonii.AAC.1